MKKVILGLLLVLASSYVDVKAQNAGNEIDFQVGLVDPTENHEPYQKSPIQVPSVSLEGHTLLFATSCDGCTLCLSDDNGTVAFSTVIPTGTTSLVLPSYLLGEYKIQIIQGNICFYGYIVL